MKTYCSLEKSTRCGITLLEVVVVIAVIAILIALFLPAVQSTREAARLMECRNHLRQIGLAVQNHDTTYRQFPSNGWGYSWVGDSGRGFNTDQPGGWIFNLLPFLDAESIRLLEKPAKSEAERRQLRTKRLSIPVKLFKCPTRPSQALGPAHPELVPINADWIPNVAKTDYAINEGNWISDTRSGPASLEMGDGPAYKWKDLKRANGVSFQRSRVTAGHIIDGLSQTVLVGEKYVNRLAYRSADDPGHDQSMYSGVDLDLNRWTTSVPLQDAATNAERRFGSAHHGGCLFVFCDGSVRQISYRTDSEVFEELGTRNGILSK